MTCNQPSSVSKKSLKVSNPSKIYYITSTFKEDTFITYNAYKVKHLKLRNYDSICDYKNCYKWPDAKEECAASNVFIYPSLTLSLHLNSDITYTFPLQLCLKEPVWEFISSDDRRNCLPEDIWIWWGWWWWGWWWWGLNVACRSIALYYRGSFNLGRSTELEQCLPDWITSACKWSETDIYGNRRYFDSSCWHAFVFGVIMYSPPPTSNIPNICYYSIASAFMITFLKMCIAYDFKPTICPDLFNISYFCTSDNTQCTPIQKFSWGNSGCPQEATSNSFYWVKDVYGLGYLNNECISGKLEVWY
jgi:hypothetical protein